MKHTELSMSLNDKVAKTYVLYGRIKMEMGDVEGASEAFVQAQKVDPRSVDAEYYQGILAERIDRRDEALTHYQAACELDASNPQYAIAAAEIHAQTAHLVLVEENEIAGAVVVEVGDESAIRGGRQERALEPRRVADRVGAVAILVEPVAANVDRAGPNARISAPVSSLSFAVADFSSLKKSRCLFPLTFSPSI